jgi:hypothetical protein
MDEWQITVQLPAAGKDFPSLQHPDWLWGLHSILLSGYMGFFLR